MVEVLLRTPAAPAVQTRLRDPRETLHAPHLLDLEVAQVLRRYVLAGQIVEARGRQALDALAVFPLFRYPHAALLPRVWQLRSNLTAYDASYVALAEVLGARLVTRDARLGSSVGHRARIEVV